MPQNEAHGATEEPPQCSAAAIHPPSHLPRAVAAGAQPPLHERATSPLPFVSDLLRRHVALIIIALSMAAVMGTIRKKSSASIKKLFGNGERWVG